MEGPPDIALSDDEWTQMLEEHVALWCRVAERIRGMPDDVEWDAVECWLGYDDAYLSVWPAKLNAPFWRKTRFDDYGERRHHVSQHTDYEELLVCVPLAELDARLGDWILDRLDAPQRRTRAERVTDAGLHDQFRALRVRAVAESLADPRAVSALADVAPPESIGVYWSPQTDSGHYVHLHHLRGPAVPEAEPPTNTISALAPLYWHHQSYIGRHHVGLVYDDDQLVEATLAGMDVTDETIAFMTPEAARCCESLRVLRFTDTRVSAEALARLQTMLPWVNVTAAVD